MVHQLLKDKLAVVKPKIISELDTFIEALDTGHGGRCIGRGGPITRGLQDPKVQTGAQICLF